MYPCFQNSYGQLVKFKFLMQIPVAAINVYYKLVKKKRSHNMTHFFQSVICHAHFYFLSMLQSLWGYQAEGLYFLGHWYVCCWPSGKYHEESAQSAPCVYTCPGRWGFQSLFLLAEKKMLYFPQMWQGQLVTITFPCLLLYRACMGWRTKSSWASLVSWATVAWQMSFTWRWSLRRRSSWWRVLRPCGVYRRSSLCEKHVSEFSSCP